MRARPEWARWPEAARDWTLGVEEEVMLLDPGSWSLAQTIDDVLPALSPRLAGRVSAETHAAALELATGVHVTVAAAVHELAALRSALQAELRPLGHAVAVAGTHPLARAGDILVASGARQRVVYESMRELARREPTFALHVHVGVAGPEAALDLANRLRAHVPLLLALSANSPYWRGSDSGLASARTPLFGAFPRVGIPRRFGGYDDWVSCVATLIDAGAFPEPTFLWWDVRLQPRLGTVEVRVMDAQTSLRDVAALVALVQAVARLEREERYAPEALLDAPEVLEENRFLAARDGIDARFVMPGSRGRVPAREAARALVVAARPHAAALGCARELELVEELAAAAPAERQRALGRGAGGLASVVQAASAAFARPLGPPERRGAPVGVPAAG